MTIKDRFLNQVRIGDSVELVVGSKTVRGKIVSLDRDYVSINGSNNNEITMSLDALIYYERFNSGIVDDKISKDDVPVETIYDNGDGGRIDVKPGVDQKPLAGSNERDSILLIPLDELDDEAEFWQNKVSDMNMLQDNARLFIVNSDGAEDDTVKKYNADSNDAHKDSSSSITESVPAVNTSNVVSTLLSDNANSESIDSDKSYYEKAHDAAFIRKDYEKAKELYVIAIDHGDKVSTSVADMITIMLQHHEYEAASGALSKYGKYLREKTYNSFYSQIEPKVSLGVSYALGQNAMESGDNESALGHFKASVADGVKIRESLTHIIDIYTSDNKYKEALDFLDEYKMAILKDMNTSEFLNIKLDILKKADDITLVKHYKSVYSGLLKIEDSPAKCVELNFERADVVSRAGLYAEVISSCLNVLNIIKDSKEEFSRRDTNRFKIEASERICRAYMSLGNNKKAEAKAKELIELQKDNSVANAILNGTYSIGDDRSNLSEGFGASSYIEDKIASINLENELRNRSAEKIENGIFTGAKSRAKEAVRLILRGADASANTDVKSRAYFAAAKLTGQMIERASDGDILESGFTRDDFREYAAFGSYYLGSFQMASPITRDYARYCLLDAISAYRGSDKISPCLAAATSMYIDSYFVSSSGKVGKDIPFVSGLRRNSGDIQAEAFSRFIQRKIGSDITSPIKNFMVGTFSLINAAPQLKSDIVASAYASPMKAKIIDFLSGLCGEDDLSLYDNPDMVSIKEFASLWDECEKEYWGRQAALINILRSEVDYAFQIGRLGSCFDKIEEGNYNLIFSETDADLIAEYQIIISRMLRYAKTSEFTTKSEALEGANDLCAKLEESINKSPTLFGYEKLLPMAKCLSEKIGEESERLFEAYEPDINVEIRQCSSKRDLGSASAIVSILNKANVQNADSVSVSYSSIDASTANGRLGTILLSGNGKPVEDFVDIKLLPGDKVDSCILNIKIRYKYRKSLSMWADNDLEFNLPLQFENIEFKPVPNRFNSYKNGNQVMDPSMFYGRDEDIRKIIDQIKENDGSYRRGRCLALYGQTRTGKSSMLYHLETRLRGIDKEKYVIINLGSIGDLGMKGSDIINFLYAVIDHLAREIKVNHPNLWQLLKDNNISIDPSVILNYPDRAQVYFNTVFKNINECGTFKSDYSIVLMIDEFTYIYDWIRRGKMTEDFMKFWKAFIQNSGVFAIVVGQDHMMKFIHDPRFTNDFGAIDVHKITYLKEEYAKRLMYEPAMTELSNGSMMNRYYPEALDRLYELTSGSAFLIMNLCAGLIDYVNQNRIIRITRAHVDDYLKESFHSFDEARFFEPQYDDKSVLDKERGNRNNIAMLHKIAMFSNGNEWTKLNEIIESVEDEQILNSLEQRDVVEIRKDRGVCKIKVYLYKEWIIAEYGMAV